MPLLRLEAIFFSSITSCLILIFMPFKLSGSKEKGGGKDERRRNYRPLFDLAHIPLPGCQPPGQAVALDGLQHNGYAYHVRENTGDDEKKLIANQKDSHPG